MRPLRLAVKGFTAFRDEQEIDFDGLDLFAISGPTGSGKSSILDAITYALYGRVERIGKQGVNQLISQGQPAMSAIFEFVVDDSRFRVARRTSARGVTQILVERGAGDTWVQAGDGADKVGTANRIVEQAIGLDYDAFTRTVLLPQGRFAEFLVGDAADRRKILTEILGLDLFERLGRRAGEIKRHADAQAQAKTQLLETEYAGVTPQAVAEAEALAEEAAHREQTLAAAEDAVREIADRWSAGARAIAELRTCERDLREAGAVARDVADALDQVVERELLIAAELTERQGASAAAERSSAKARAAREKHEDKWGRPVDLVAHRAKGEAFVAATQALVEAEAELRTAGAALPKLEAARGKAEDALKTASADAEAAIEALAAAETALEDARHADLVVAVRAGVRVGEACPVCGSRIESLPKAPKAVPLVKAGAARDRAKVTAEQAHAALTEAERSLDRATQAVRVAEKDRERCRRAAEKERANVERFRKDLAAAFGARIPADPVSAIDERRARLEDLERAERDAQEALDDARVALQRTEHERDAQATRLAEARGRLGALAVSGLLDRARGLADGGEAAPAPLTGEEAAAALLEGAVAISGALERAAETLATAAEARGAEERDVARAAVGHLEGPLEIDRPDLTVGEVVALASDARTAAAREAATAADRARATAEKLANAAALVEQVAEHQARAAVFDALAKELRADRVTAFLQVEALQLLAAAGSARLATLSSDRYRLDYVDDEFFVVDTWNGEERRSARTLSGGETFLASLALALALSEQVGSLAVTEKARLDSLFLDEGFGTLDPDTLEVVVEAIEQLGGDGRMVGVITHVPELAARLPVRIEIEKSPRGSRVVRSAAT